MNSNRRSFLLSGAAIAVAGAFGLSRFAKAENIVGVPGKVRIHQFTDKGKSIGVVEVDKVVKSDDEWQKQLASAPVAGDGSTAFKVARQEGTEYPGTGPNWDNHSAGLYRCICCDTAVFDSKTKFESGTGWPSFWQPIDADAVELHEDKSLFMRRTEVTCARCGGHLGHVFNDGPRPTGERYCMNSVSLQLDPTDEERTS